MERIYPLCIMWDGFGMDFLYIWLILGRYCLIELISMVSASK